MKKFILTIIISAAASVFCGGLSAQTTVPEGYELADSVVYVPVSAVDTTLAGKDIFNIMPSKGYGSDAGVTINQSNLVSGSMKAHIRSNDERTMSGYRVRIFLTTGRAPEMSLKRL